MMKNIEYSKNIFWFSLRLWSARITLLLLAMAGSFSLQAQLPTLNWAGQLKMSNGISSTYGLSGGLSISRDATGNVYTVGNYYSGIYVGTIDMDPGNNPGDTFILHAPFDPFGASITAGYISKLDASGHFAWGQNIWSNHANVGIEWVATDAEGNVYTTGSFPDTAHFGALTLYAHPNPDPAFIFAPGDAFVSKQDAQGHFAWVTQIGGNYGDAGMSVALSANGNIVVLGYAFDTVQAMTAGGPVTLYGSDNAPYVFVAALRSSTGGILWIKQFGDDNGNILSQAAFAKATGITLDSEGNIYLEGSLSGTVDFDPGPGSYPLSGDADMVVCKLNAQGDFVWVAKTETYGNGSVAPSAIFADGAGNVYTTGSYNGKIDFDPGPDTAFLNAEDINHIPYDIFICKWNSNGDFSWVRAITRTQADTGFLPGGGFTNHATSIFADESGNVYTTGNMQGYMDLNSDTAASDTLIFVSNTAKSMGYIQKLDAQGNFRWAIPIKDKEGYYRSSANAIIKDDSGHLYITGGFNGTVDFDPNGGTYNLSGGGAFVLKLNDTAGNNSGVGIGAAEIKSGNIIQLYPNPAGNELWLKGNGRVQLKTVLVYNMLGQELRREKVSSKGLYRMDVRSLASGLYLLKALLSDGRVAQGKFEIRR